MNARQLLGIDIGTSGLKCVLIDDAGQLLASAFREYATDLPRPGWAEQNPDVWLHATMAGVREVGPAGHFLGTQHTLEHFEKAFFIPSIMLGQ